MDNIIEEEIYFTRETKITNKETRFKKIIKENHEDYNEDSIEEVAKLLFTSKQEVMRIAEGNFDDDIRKLIEFANHYSVSIDYILGLTDNRNP